MLNLNTKLFTLINNLALTSSFWDAFFLILTTSMSVAFFVLIIGYVLWHRHHNTENIVEGMMEKYREVLIIGITVSATFLLVVGIKVLVGLPRPFLVVPTIRSLLIYGGNNSFPSNHAAVFASLAMSLYPAHKTTALLVGVLALLIGFSRIYVGVHYPLDVIAGFAIGVGVALVTKWLFARYRKYTLRHASSKGQSLP